MRSQEYWRNRAIDREAAARELSEKALSEKILKAYSRAQEQLEADAKKVFEIFQREGEMTHAQANKLLGRAESEAVLTELREKLDSITDPALRRKALNRLQAPAYRARIRRMDALRMRIRADAAKLADEQISTMTQTLKDVARETYYRHIFDTQHGIGLAFDFAPLPEKAIAQIVGERYAGAHFSARVWQDVNRTADAADKILSSGIVFGKSVYRMAKELEEATQSGKYAAARLIRTEANRVYNEAEMAANEEEGVAQFRYIATLDLLTCKVCGKKDGKVFDMSEREQGVNYPPMHPNDRCTTEPVMDGEVMEGFQRRARDPVTGRPMLVPRGMNWEQWRKENGLSNDLQKSEKTATLTEEERGAINTYLSSDSYTLNAALRGEEQITPEQERFARNLDSALEKLPNYVGVVYRSIDGDMLEDTDKFVKSHVVGEDKRFPSYTSSGTEVYDETLSIQYIINSKTGKDMRRFNPNESEILFRRDTVFLVDKKEGNTIFMTEVYNGK